MDVLNDELLKFWKTLAENNVKYIIGTEASTNSL